VSVLPANVSVAASTSSTGRTTPYRFIETARAIEAEVGQVIIGQPEVVRGVLTCLLAGGHALLRDVSAADVTQGDA